MKNRRVVAAAVLLALAGLGLGYLVYLVRTLDTAAFRQSMLDRASAAAGTKVEAREVDFSLWQGVTLRGVSMANPPPFTGDLLTAEAFVLRYRVWPLLGGRVELSRLSLDKPVLTLAMDGRGVFNYERLAGPTRSAPAPGGSSGVPVALVLSKLSVDEARIVVRDPRSSLVTLEGAELDSALRVEGLSIEGEGQVRVSLANLADSLYVRKMSAPLQAAKGTLLLAPLEGTLAGGEVRGAVRVQTKGGLQFKADITVEGARLQDVLEEAKATPSASGTLSAKGSVQGSGGLRTLIGAGHVQVADCKVARAPLMTLLSTALRIPELAHPDFTECRADFTLGDGRLVMPSVRLKNPSMELFGRGVLRLDTLGLDYDMTLALSKPLLDRIPVRELRAGFEPRADGFGLLDFKVTGTSSEPRTDITQRLGKAAASEAAASGIKGWLKRRKIF